MKTNMLFITLIFSLLLCSFQKTIAKSTMPEQTWYKDADNDGYSDGNTLIADTQPDGYKLAEDLVETSGDCNDDDDAINPATVWFKDTDNDGYSDGTTLTQCDQPTGFKLPGDLIATSGDCNDGDAAINVLPTVTAGSYGPLCSNGAAINLGGDPSGGVWSGTGVSGNQATGYTFNPAAGSRVLTYTYSNGTCSKSNKTTIIVNTLPAKPIVSGPSTVTKQQTGLVYSVTEIAGETYTWAVSGSAQIISGQGSSSIIVNWGTTSGNVACTASNSCGSSKTTKFPVTVCSLPAKPVISGPSSVTKQQPGLVYSVTEITGETYTWAVSGSAQIISGQGSSSIIVNWGTTSGNVTCTASNNCGSSNTAKYRVTLCILPVKPIISGPATVNNQQTNLIYSVKNTEGETYTWTVPASAVIVSGQGDSSITVNWGTGPGRITCTASNACGSSTPAKFNVSISAGIATTGNSSSINSKLNQLQITLQVTPNPTLGKIRAVFMTVKPGKYVIELVDITGRLLQTTTVIANAGLNQADLNLYNYANGTYLVSLRGGEVRQTVKLVKAR